MAQYLSKETYSTYKLFSLRSKGFRVVFSKLQRNACYAGWGFSYNNAKPEKISFNFIDMQMQVEGA